MTSRTSRPILLKAILTSLCLYVCATDVLADSVKLGGFWFNNVTVQDITDGNLIFINVTGAEQVRPMLEVQGLKLSVFDDSAAADDALKAKDYQEVAKRFSSIAAEARQPWAKHWAIWHKVAALDQLGQPVEAVEAYLELVRLKADGYFLANPPLKSLRNAPDGKKKDIASRLSGLRKSLAKGPAKSPFEKMLKSLQSDKQPTDDTAGADSPDPAEKDESDSLKAEPAITMAAVMDPNDPVTRLLHAGEFEKARVAATLKLKGKELHMAMRLYQQGLAQLHLAEQSEDKQLYLDAGLSFMRVAIHFSKSSYTGPALVEAGVVHERIERHELAMKLWRKAQIEVDPETDPAVAARLETMISSTKR